VPAKGALAPADEALLGAARRLLPRLRAEYAEQAFHKALETVFEVVAAANRYIDEQAPWTLRKTDLARMATVLWVAAETIRHLAILMQPVVPEAAGKLLDQLGATSRDFAALDAAPLAPGTKLPKPEGVFPRYVET
jgi:methionyl-tRNA synthetase